MMDGEEPRVTVAVRIRPKLASAVNALQQSERYEEVVCVPTSDTALCLSERRAAKVPRTMPFAFDHVFDLDATQEEVYEAAALDAVDSVLGGTNASLLTYGQTGSGKTHTVLGKVGESGSGDAASAAVVGPDSGLLLRAIHDMIAFAARVRSRDGRHVVLGITAIEIYNDTIRDLLRDGAAPLQPVMTRDALHFPKLTHMPLTSLRDACAVYEAAAVRRVQRATSANDASSRSHAIFTVQVFQTPPLPAMAAPPSLAECCALRDTLAMAPTGSAARPAVRCDAFDGASTVLRTAGGVPLMYSALTVADLAGSEKAKHADVHGAGFDELRRINASLTALGNVVHHLHHGSPHIPYRDSKLTMVLRDTFAAPRARVVLFVNVSPTALTCEETLSSLYFADKMKGMTTLDRAASPQQAALQAGYLSSLRTHDALLAEMRVFQAQHELTTGLLQRVAGASRGDGHPLFQLPFHTVVGEGEDKEARLRRLCAQMRREVSASETPEARLQQYAEAARQAMVREALATYSQRRAAVQSRTAEVEEANAAIEAQQAQAKAAMRQTLLAEKAALQRAQAARQELWQAVASLSGTLAAATDGPADCESQSGLAEQATDSVGSVRGDASVTSEDTDGHAAAEAHRKALELSELRLTLAELLAYRLRTSPPPPFLAGEMGSKSGSVSGSAKSRSRSRSHTAASSSAGPGTIEAWLRGAVLAMAGNAVAQSTRRRAREQRRPASRPALGDLTNLPPSTRTTASCAEKAQQLPKYWSVVTQRAAEVAQEAGTPVDSSGSARAAASAPRRLRSAFDDPALFTCVTAYMDNGAALTKIDRSGRPRQRWFYLAQREGRCMLCWDESRRRADLAGGGHAYLDAVEKIVLGRSSPGFLKHASLCDGGSAGDEMYSSFTLVYRTRANHRDFKFVDVVCPSRSEMETWVVGLSHWSGVLPIFEDSRQPDDAVEEPLETPAAAGDAEGGAAVAAQEAVLCRAWHIPAEVLEQSRREINARRVRHQSGRMRLTPGELRDLTGLDIFRASALWRHFEREGWVVNPTKELHCFVE